MTTSDPATAADSACRPLPLISGVRRTGQAGVRARHLPRAIGTLLGWLALLMPATAQPPAGPLTDDAGIAAGLAAGRLVLRSIHMSDQGRLGVSVVDAQGQPHHWSPGSCAAAYRAVRQQARPAGFGAAPFMVQVSWGLVSHGGRAIVDLEADLCRPAEQDPPATVAREITLLSIVGPVLSYAEQRSEALAGGPPYHLQAWKAVDIRSGAAVDVRDVAEPGSLLQALRQDRVVRQLLGAPLAHATLDRLLASLQPDGGPVPFALHRIHRATGHIDLRLAVRRQPACGLCVNELTQIGLRVRAHPAVVVHLDSAVPMSDSRPRPRP